MKPKKQMPYILAGPIITLGIMLVLYAVSGVYPFGNASTAFADGFAQYVPFIAELKYKIAEGSSMFFTWHTGGGVNFWTTIGYYLTSPLNLIALLFPVERMNDAFSLITLIKPALMALTFSLFLKHAYKKNDFSVAIFSVLWAMSGFMVGGLNITSWFDAIIYFPLVIMGLKRLMDGGSAWLYSLFLGLTITSNFYIGWIVCIFCVVYFIYSFVSDDDVTYEGVTVPQDKTETEDGESINIFALFQNSYLLKSILKFGLSSLLAGGISAIFTLPIANALQNTGKGAVTESTFTIEGDGFFGLLASHIFPFKNTYNSLGTMEAVFCFVGVVTLILTVAYFFAKGISVRKKIGNGFLLVVMWVSMLVRAIYVVWHGFGEPAGIMYRFAFVYSFVLLKIAYEAFCEIKNIKWYGILAGTVFAGLCTACVYFNNLFNAFFLSTELIIKIAIAVVVFTVILIIMSKKERAKSTLTVILLVCVIVESIAFNSNNLNILELDENLAENKIVTELTENLDESDRIHFASKEQEYKDMVMYGSIFGYNSYENYSSLADNRFGLTITDLGTYGNRLNFQNGASEQTPIFNMLFPTNYYIDGTGNLSESSYRTKITEKDGYTLYKNNYTMPFMFTVSTDISEWDPFGFFVVMDNLNVATKAVSGTGEDVAVYNTPTNFKFENCTHISVEERLDANNIFDEASHNHSNEAAEEHDHENAGNSLLEYYQWLEQRMSGYSYKIDDMTKSASITFDSVAEADGIMYLYVDTYEFVDMTVTFNGKTTEYYLYGAGDNCTYELGEVKKGDVATITIGGHVETDFENGHVYAYENNSFTTTSFTVDMEKFDSAYNKLDAMSDTEMLEFDDTYVKAKVTSYEDGLLYIPTTYDEGWTVLIDGVETELYEHHSHVLMVPITEGEHVVEMTYCPVGFVQGAVITGVSVVILIAWVVISTKRFKKELTRVTIDETTVNEG